MKISGRIKILGSHFPQVEFAKDDIVHGSIDWHSMTSSFEEGETDVRE